MNTNKGSIVKQSGNDVEGCRSEKVSVQTNMRVFLQYSVMIQVMKEERKKEEKIKMIRTERSKKRNRRVISKSRRRRRKYKKIQRKYGMM